MITFFQIIVLAKVITGSDQVTLTARGVTILVKLLQSDKNTTVAITGKFRSKGKKQLSL